MHKSYVPNLCKVTKIIFVKSAEFFCASCTNRSKQYFHQLHKRPCSWTRQNDSFMNKTICSFHEQRKIKFSWTKKILQFMNKLKFYNSWTKYKRQFMNKTKNVFHEQKPRKKIVTILLHFYYFCMTKYYKSITN